MFAIETISVPRGAANPARYLAGTRNFIGALSVEVYFQKVPALEKLFNVIDHAE